MGQIHWNNSTELMNETANHQRPSPRREESREGRGLNGITIRVYSFIDKAYRTRDGIFCRTFVCVYVRSQLGRMVAPVWVGPQGWARSQNLP
eukprot:9175292-Pyramimonas_sp.AAC.4